MEEHSTAQRIKIKILIRIRIQIRIRIRIRLRIKDKDKDNYEGKVPLMSRSSDSYGGSDRNAQGEVTSVSGQSQLPPRSEQRKRCSMLCSFYTCSRAYK